jgi:hypothetical protein
MARGCTSGDRGDVYDGVAHEGAHGGLDSQLLRCHAARARQHRSGVLEARRFLLCSTWMTGARCAAGQGPAEASAFAEMMAMRQQTRAADK